MACGQRAKFFPGHDKHQGQNLMSRIKTAIFKIQGSKRRDFLLA